MATSPPTSPPSRPLSSLVRPAPRSHSRMSTSRASDDDAKTSVKVAVRLRPPLKPSDPGFELIPQRFQRSMVHVNSPTSLSVDSPQGRKLFVFDKVFGEDVSQDGVWEYVTESVGAFLQGYNVSVMAYGQSGAGKSFTMGTSGPTEQADKELMGVVPRAAAALFESLSPSPNLTRNGSGIKTPNRFSMGSVPTLSGIKANGAAGEKTWQMKATYVEIYNEQLRDLLLPESTPANERGAVTIREDTKGRILLTGLHQVTINSIEDLLKALNFGSLIRQTDATTINAKSSRSHAVFSLNLIQRKNKKSETSARDKRLSMPVDSMMSGEGWMTVDSKLHFVDLAGSERLKNTGASGERAKEGISINAGLASLGKVISQLSARQHAAHVSYRDSKLTRLLQDSLGGNAITYMIACVNPAEFHLSETLNTIQYAQRARNIQSKPRIQQVSDDSDKQALIDRLRAEVNFLRDQLRNTDRSDRVGAPQDRTDRSNERELDLQNHLLDVQENYTALTQRHAKLISEISKVRENSDEELPLLTGAVGESAVERLQRSNSFSEAVEQVVLEYEKTIQSLESLLTTTRSSLSSTESKLLEKETECAFADTFNQQLQQRIQKLIDREASTEQYLHNLEAKMDGRVVGEEKSSAAVIDLRKEIARLRENESTSEEYISTLEERLAEADQDAELRQREIERLEHLVERQRSVGKLDNLLYELDHNRPQSSATNGEHPLTNGVRNDEAPTKEYKRDILNATYKVAIETPIPEAENEDEDWDEKAGQEADGNAVTPEPPAPATAERYPQSPAQSKFVEEKLESVNQELFDLRVEHESTINDYSLLSAKYEEALRTLAAMHDSVGENGRPPHSPTAFLADARVNELKSAGQPSSSRSLLLELSSAGELPDGSVHSEGAMQDSEEAIDELSPRDTRYNEIPTTNGVQPIHGREDLKAMHADTEAQLASLQRQHEELQEQHVDTLDLVEELKAEVQKARMFTPPSPTSQLLRRKSSQTVMNIDRAHRSLASLGNIASDHFEDNPELKESFELHMGSVMHELHQRSERVQLLETELATVKKEMESKMAIISGLTRERSSLQSPVDMSMLSTMRDQLLQSEHQLHALQEASRSRENSLNVELESLKDTLASKANAPSSGIPGMFPETPAAELVTERELSNGSAEGKAELESQVAQLQNQLSEVETKHKAATAAMKTSEGQLMDTITELETTLERVESARQAKGTELDAQVGAMTAATAAFELERQRHAETVSSLTKEVEEHKTLVDGHLSKIAELVKSNTEAQQEIAAGNDFKRETSDSLDQHKNQISALEGQLSEHQASVERHKFDLIALHDSHDADLEEFRSSAAKDAEEYAENRIAELNAQHSTELENLYTKTKDLESRLQEHQLALQQHREEADQKGALINQLEQEKKSHTRTVSDATEDIRMTKSKLQATEEAKTSTEASLSEAQTQLEELRSTKVEMDKELISVREKEQRARRLVEELEGQLNSTFEDSQQVSSRLSLMQNGREQELAEARAATAKAHDEIAVLHSRLDQLESNRGSMMGSSVDTAVDRSSTLSANTIRKNGGVTTLPSPPPVIPLPPLPPSATSNSPPGTSHKEVVPQASIEQENRIRTIEKHLFAEKQLTATLEEALVDLEREGKKVKAEIESWKKKAWDYEDELNRLKKERNANRHSLQAVEEERSARKEAEAARAHLEERMAALNKKKKKSTLNCF